ncbi:MAG: family 20 glycosylhydrolase [Cyclobacteriaceae bacterium]
MRKIILILSIWAMINQVTAQEISQVNAFAIAAPKPARLAQFIEFVEQELAPAGINTLVLRVDYNYEFTSYPQLRYDQALSKEEVKGLISKTKSLGIEVVPQINLLGHQSWAEGLEKLLEQFPQFDETPHVKMPKEYKWPNDDGLYCKSYCPLHPEVHDVVFALVDEIMEVFEADNFHAGMDEVFYLGDDQCPRCAGKNKAELFAKEVTLIRDHLAKQNRRLWIWGDRLLEGTVSGLGMWEASENGTESAIDMIPKDVMICDWHYETAEPTPVIFAAKGFDVISCFWNRPTVATAHMEMIDQLRSNANKKMKTRYRGTMQTIWSPAGGFMDAWNTETEEPNGQVESLKSMINYLRDGK